MTHPGWIGGFPGNWTYQGDAKLLVKTTVQVITIGKYCQCIMIIQCVLKVNIFTVI